MQACHHFQSEWVNTGNSSDGHFTWFFLLSPCLWSHGFVPVPTLVELSLGVPLRAPVGEENLGLLLLLVVENCLLTLREGN